MLYGMIDEIIKSKICMFCKHHCFEISCANEKSEYFGRLRNSYESCKDFELKEEV